MTLFGFWDEKKKGLNKTQSNHQTKIKKKTQQKTPKKLTKPKTTKTKKKHGEGSKVYLYYSRHLK